MGTVAYEERRALADVEFSQTYMLVRQSFLVLDGSSFEAVADINRAGRLGGTKKVDDALPQAHPQAGDGG